MKNILALLLGVLGIFAMRSILRSMEINRRTNNLQSRNALSAEEIYDEKLLERGVSSDRFISVWQRIGELLMSVDTVLLDSAMRRQRFCRTLACFISMLAVCTTILCPCRATLKLAPAPQAQANAALLELWSGANGQFDKNKADKVSVEQVRSWLSRGADPNARTPGALRLS